MKLTLINELCESQLFRQKKQVEKLSLQKLANLIFLYACILTILKNEPKYSNVAKVYAKKTVMYGGWKEFRTNGTDLYVLLYQFFKKDTLKNDVYINRDRMKKWLFSLTKDATYKSRNMQYLLKLERELKIRNSQYKTIRRLGSDWDNLKQGQRSFITSRLIQIFRQESIIRSELYPVLLELSKEKKIVSTGHFDKFDDTEELSTKSKVAVGAAAVAGATLAGYAFGKRIGGKRSQRSSYR